MTNYIVSVDTYDDYSESYVSRYVHIFEDGTHVIQDDKAFATSFTDIKMARFIAWSLFHSEEASFSMACEYGYNSYSDKLNKRYTVRAPGYLEMCPIIFPSGGYEGGSQADDWRAQQS